MHVAAGGDGVWPLLVPPDEEVEEEEVEEDEVEEPPDDAPELPDGGGTPSTDPPQAASAEPAAIAVRNLERREERMAVDASKAHARAKFAKSLMSLVPN